MIESIAERQARLRYVAHMKDVEGRTFEEIGDVLGVSRQRANQLYQASQQKEEPAGYWFMAYDCPVTGGGHFSLDLRKAKRKWAKKPTRLELTFSCVSCEGEHTITIYDEKI